MSSTTFKRTLTQRQSSYSAQPKPRSHRVESRSNGSVWQIPCFVAGMMALFFCFLMPLPLMAAGDAPVAIDDPSVTTDEDTSVVISPLGNDTDADLEPLNISSITAPVAGTAAISGTQVVYTPTLNVNGVDTFTYVASDGTLTDTASITVTINPLNDSPVAVDDADITTLEGTTVVIEPLVNDVDVDGDALSLLWGGSSPYSGTIEITGTQIIYTPDPNFYGVDIVRYRVDDGVETDTGVVTITVAAVNDPPYILPAIYSFQWGNEGDRDGEFDSVEGLTIGPDGTIYVLDNGNDLVQTFDGSGAFLTKWGSYGDAEGEFDDPDGGIVADSNGDIYVGGHE